MAAQYRGQCRELPTHVAALLPDCVRGNHIVYWVDGIFGGAGARGPRTPGDSYGTVAGAVAVCNTCQGYAFEFGNDKRPLDGWREVEPGCWQFPATEG